MIMLDITQWLILKFKIKRNTLCHDFRVKMEKDIIRFQHLGKENNTLETQKKELWSK
jgi:hypothetical protein